MSTLSLTVGASGRDATQSSNGGCVINAAQIGTVTDYWGIAWTGVTIAKNSWIARATIATYCVKSAGGTGSTTIYGEAANNATVYTTANNNISNRTKTTASVSWAPSGLAAGYNDSPNVASLLQEVVTRASWASGNAFSTIWVNGTTVNSPYGYLIYTYDQGTAYAPTLTVDYFAPSNATLAQGNVPSGIGVTVGIGTATITGRITTNTTGIGVTVGIGTPTVTTTLTTTTSGISVTTDLGVPTTTTSITTSPSGIAIASNVGVVTTSQTTPGTSAAPAGIEITAAVGTVTVTAGTIIATVTGIAITTTVGSSTGTAGGVTATVNGISITIAIGAARARSLPSARDIAWIALPATSRYQPGAVLVRWIALAAQTARHDAGKPTQRWQTTAPSRRWTAKGPTR